MKNETSKLIIKTVVAMFFVMLFYFIAGAAVVTRNLQGTEAKLTQGVFIWISVIGALVSALIKYKSLKIYNFSNIRVGSSRFLLYYIPVVLVALSGISNGLDMSEGPRYIFASMFLTIGVGLSEEIYFRGIICNLWRRKSDRTAIIVSSVLFGVCHLMNVLGGAGVFETILQVCFAFLYGIVFALIFIETESIWPCVILHFMHDFCSFIGRDFGAKGNIIIGTIQTVILLIYIIYIIKGKREEKDYEKKIG